MSERHSNEVRKATKHLCTFTIVLIFTSEFLVLKPIENLADRLGGLGKHRLKWNAWC